MNETKKERREKWLPIFEKWGPVYLFVCCLLGAFLGAFLVYLKENEIVWELIYVPAIMTAVFILIHFVKWKRKKNNLPPADERIAKNVFRVFAYTSFVFLFFLFIYLGVVTFLGYEEVSLLFLWLFFFAYIWVVGIGTFIVSRR